MIDYEQLAQGIEEAREAIRALVAGLREDGFTDREARAIAAGIFANKIGEGE